MSGAIMGFDGVLGYKVGGVAGGGSYTALNPVRDVQLNLTKAEADATTRGNNGWTATLAGLKDGTLEFDLVWDPTDPGFDALRSAWESGDPIGIAASDGPLSSGRGWEFDAQVFDFGRGEPLNDVMTVSVKIKPTYSGTAPAYFSDGVNAGGSSGS